MRRKPVQNRESQADVAPFVRALGVPARLVRQIHGGNWWTGKKAIVDGL
jgi:hypothetical protein